MSSIVISGDTSGSITLSAPAVSGSSVLTLPAVTDTVAGIAATQTLTNKTLTSPTLTTPNVNSAQVDTVSGTAPLYFCRAWVNFNGTGTVAIRASGNVTSITDNGTGRYTINFITAMPDVNYAAVFNGNGNQDTFGVGGRQFAMVRARATGSVEVNAIDDGGGAEADPSYIGAAIFR